MHRFYLSAERPEKLTPEDAHHALHVLRLSPGDQIEVFLSGIRYLAEIASCDGDQVNISILHSLPSAEPALHITLYQGLPKFDKMEWIVQKAVELGASRVVPLEMSRCISHPDEKSLAGKAERWRKIAREAGKQSGRSIVPEVSHPIRLNRLPDSGPLPDRIVVPWEDCRGTGPRSFVQTFPQLHSLGIVIGPEGGISPDEIRYLESIGCKAITLGPRILRTETAGLAAISAFMALFGEME